MISRDERQEIGVNSLVNNNGGTVVAFTGFGKTRIAFKAIDKFQPILSKGILNILVVVPTIDLKNQWESKLQNLKDIVYRVLVVNSIIQKEEVLKADLVIYDEIHTYLKGEQFSKVFKLTEATRDTKIGLTATLSNEEKEIVNSILPIVDTITLNEGVKNKWVTDFVEYNLFIDFKTQEERDDYDKIHQLHDECFAYFNQEFETANKCSNKWGAETFVKERKFFPNKSEEEGGGRMNVFEATKFICEKANIWRDCVKKRSDIINTYYGKLDIVEEIVNKFSLRYITFGSNTETCDILTDRLPFSKSFHSSIESQEIERGVLLKYELIKPTIKEQKLLALYPEQVYSSTIKVKCGNDRLNKLYLKQLEAGDIKGINTAKKADLGLDIAGVDGILIYGRNSVKGKQTQRVGRGIRKEGDKFTLIVNVVIRKTKDEAWLKSAQWGTYGQVVVNSVEELVNHFNNIVK